MNKLLITLAASLVAIGSAQAQGVVANGNPLAGVYVGASVSGAKNETIDDWKAGGKVFAGYNFDQNWAVEAGHTRFDSQEYRVTSGPGANDAFVKSNSSYLAAKYTLPLNGALSAYGKLGASYNERKGGFRNTNWNDHDTGMYGAVGLQYALTKNVSLVGEYERYGKEKDNGAKADVVSAGVQYAF